MKEVIKAHDKHGQEAQVGAFVVIVNANGKKYTGKIISIGKSMKFRSMNFARLQIYSVKCRDGSVRPAISRHIKYVSNRRRAG